MEGRIEESEKANIKKVKKELNGEGRRKGEPWNLGVSEAQVQASLMTLL